MSMVTRSHKKKRIYQRKFDHDECRGMRFMGGMTYKELAEHFGVTTTSIRRVCDENFRASFDARTKSWLMSGTCRACGGSRVKLERSRGDYTDTGLCRKCWAESRQQRFRFDELGHVAAIRCTTCKQWKPVDEFPRAKAAAREYHGQCRPCGTKQRQEYRERHKIPCKICGAPCLPANEKGPRGKDTRLCLACYREAMREPRPELRLTHEERLARRRVRYREKKREEAP